MCVRCESPLDDTISNWLCRQVFDVRFYATNAGRSQPTDFLGSLSARDRAQIVADITALRDHGLQAPISMKPIKGRPNRGLFEIRRAVSGRCSAREAVWSGSSTFAGSRTRTPESRRPAHG